MNSPKRNQTTLRLPKDIDAKLSDTAKRIGISKNALILTMLAKALGVPITTLLEESA